MIGRGTKIRIGIDGAQGVGKTTLLADLAAEFGTQFEYIPEAARIIAPLFGVMSAEDWQPLLADQARLEEFFGAEQAWLIEREERARWFMVDSSLWLIAAYRERFGCGDGVSVARNRNYDLLLYCAAEDRPRPDGFRFTEYRDEVDATYRALVGRYFEGALVKLPEGSRRLAVAIEAIENELRLRHSTE